MSRYVDLLGAAADQARQATPPAVEYVGTVTAVRDDGTVNLLVRGGTLFGVPCLSSYAPRAKDDVVVARKTQAGWYVAGPTGPDAVAPQIPEETLVTWGTGLPPGSGWVQASTVWVNDHAVYGQVASGPPPPGPVAKPDSVPVTDQGSWRGGKRRDDKNYPVQGDWGGWGANTGAWFYGTALHDAVNAGTVSKVTVRLVRQSARHGRYGNVPVHLYVHPHSAAPRGTPGTTAGPWVVASLQLGEADTVTLPAAAVTALQGSGRGLKVYAGHSDYIWFTPGCGGATVYYQ